MTLEAFPDQRPSAADVLRYLPWIEEAQGLPAGHSTPFLIAHAIRYVETGEISDLLSAWSREIGVVLTRSRSDVRLTPKDDRFVRGMTLIARLLVGWVERGETETGELDYVDLPDHRLETVAYDWSDRTWNMGTLDFEEDENMSGYTPNPRYEGQDAYNIGFRWGNQPEDNRTAETLWKDGGGKDYVKKSARDLFLQGVADGRAAPFGAVPGVPVEPEPEPATELPDPYIIGFEVGAADGDEQDILRKIERSWFPDHFAYEDALERAREGYKASKRAQALSQDIVVVYTDAPEDYDQFRTFTVDRGHGLSKRGSVRRVAIESKNVEYQLARYSSGLHFALTEHEWPEAREFIIEHNSAEVDIPEPLKPPPEIAAAPATVEPTVEYLDEFPPNTELKPRPRLSSWGGHLALVHGPMHDYSSMYGSMADFDPETLSRKYTVDLLVNVGGAPIEATPELLDREPSWRKTPGLGEHFEVTPYGGYGYQAVKGRHGPRVIVWTTIPLKELWPSEQRALAGHLDAAGYKDVSSYPKLSVSWWRKAFKDVGTGVKDVYTHLLDESNDFYNFLVRKVDRDSTDTPESAHHALMTLGGVYALTKKGDFKYVVDNPYQEEEEPYVEPPGYDPEGPVEGIIQESGRRTRTKRFSDLASFEAWLRSEIEQDHHGRIEEAYVYLGKKAWRYKPWGARGVLETWRRYAPASSGEKDVDIFSTTPSLAGASPEVQKLMRQKVDLRPKSSDRPGDYPDLHTKLALELSREIERSKDPDYATVSWASQEAAQDYFNEHGFEETLDYMTRLRQENDERAAHTSERGIYTYTSDTEPTPDELPPGVLNITYNNYDDVYDITYERRLPREEASNADLRFNPRTPEERAEAAGWVLEELARMPTYGKNQERWADDFNDPEADDHDFAVDTIADCLSSAGVHRSSENVEKIGDIIAGGIYESSRAPGIHEIDRAIPGNPDDQKLGKIRELMRLVLGEVAWADAGRVDDLVYEYNEEHPLPGKRKALSESTFAHDPLGFVEKLLTDPQLLGEQATSEYVASVDDVPDLAQGVLFIRAEPELPAIILDTRSRQWFITDPHEYLRRFPGRFRQVEMWEVTDPGRWNPRH